MGSAMVKAAAGFIPIVGSIIDGIDLYKDPSWFNAAMLGLSLAGDCASFIGGKELIAPLEATLKARKAMKAANAMIDSGRALNSYSDVSRGERALRNATKDWNAALNRLRLSYGKIQFGDKVLSPAEARLINLTTDTVPELYQFGQNVQDIQERIIK